jgi:hypothetical protein
MTNSWAFHNCGYGNYNTRKKTTVTRSWTPHHCNHGSNNNGKPKNDNDNKLSSSSSRPWEQQHKTTKNNDK